MFSMFLSVDGIVVLFVCVFVCVGLISIGLFILSWYWLIFELLRKIVLLFVEIVVKIGC